MDIVIGSLCMIMMGSLGCVAYSLYSVAQDLSTLVDRSE